jgi:hypothetical protein
VRIKPLTEKQIEKAIKEEALKLGYLTYKFTSPANRGVPDRLFINPNGLLFFIEFKSKMGKLTALQAKVFRDIASKKTLVFVINDVEKGVKLLKILLSKKIQIKKV